MEDLISKQDAVNTSLEFFVEFLGGALHENVQKELITRFQRLPSAHPELDEWCTECKEYDHEKHNCPRYNRVIREAVEEMRQENEWTPCSKELPTEDGDYLVTLEKCFAEDYGSELVIIMNFEVDCESFGYWYESFDPNTLGSLGSDWREIPVTAWKPLSEPWEGEKDENR